MTGFGSREQPSPATNDIDPSLLLVFHLYITPFLIKCLLTHDYIVHYLSIINPELSWSFYRIHVIRFANISDSTLILQCLHEKVIEYFTKEIKEFIRIVTNDVMSASDDCQTSDCAIFRAFVMRLLENFFDLLVGDELVGLGIEYFDIEWVFLDGSCITEEGKFILQRDVLQDSLADSHFLPTTS